MADTEYVLNSKITVKTKNDVTFAKNNIRASAIKSYVDKRQALKLNSMQMT